MPVTRHLFNLTLVLSLIAITAHAGEWPKKTFVYEGSTPTLDGFIAPGEYADATRITVDRDWTSQFSPVTAEGDLDGTVWIKHDGRDLYFAFDISDDLIYGFDIDRWLPDNNASAHELTRQGWPWFGDGVEVLVNAANEWSSRDGQSNAGDGSSWQMVCSTHKSRLDGVGVGGLMEGEERSQESAWNNYQKWILEGSMEAAVRVKDRATEGSGYVIEWKVEPDPCLEVEPGVYWSPALGETPMGLNLAVADLDEKETGEGNFGNFHHEEWWTGEPNKRTWLKQWGTMVLVPGPNLPTSIQTETGSLPEVTRLSQNYPNPFNAQTSIRFTLPTATRAELSIYDLAGQQVAIPLDAYLPAGIHTLHWNGRTQNDQPLASGIYFYRLQTDRMIQTRKLILLQ